MKQYKKHISTKMLSRFLLVFTLVIVICASASYMSISTHLIDDGFEGLASIRDLSRGRLLTDIHRHVELAETIADTPLIADVLLGNSSAESGSEYLRKVRSIHKGGIVDLSGATISSTDDEAIGKNIADRRYFQKAVAGASGFAGPYESIMTPEASYCIAYAPVVKSGKTIGAIMLPSELQVLTRFMQ